MRDLGVHLPRFVCLDTPAQDWMRVASILIESFDVILVDPGFDAAAGERARIAAKLRDSQATLILLGRTRSSAPRSSAPHASAPRSSAPHASVRRSSAPSFPGSTEHLTVLSEAWEGTHAGTGRLRRRVLQVHSARTGEHTLILPDPQGSVAAQDVPAGTLRLVRRHE
jgi:hypothetical protein